MADTKAWLSAFRLKTLPLSISGIIAGTFISASRGNFDIYIFSFAFLTTLFLQILSNLANDYGDGVKGTDLGREGSIRLVQSGIITPKQMFKAVVVFSILSFVSGLALVWFSFGDSDFYKALLFVAIGVAAIIAAVKYTVGQKAYGYSGFGDLFVFIFFGLVSVLGTIYLQSKFIMPSDFLPAAAIGLLSVGVLNLNNLRDYSTDKRSNKITIVVKMGVANAKLYHELLLIFAIFFLATFNYLNYLSLTQFLILIVVYPLFSHAKRVLNSQVPKDLEPELKTLALITLFSSLLFGLGIYLASFESLRIV